MNYKKTSITQRIYRTSFMLSLFSVIVMLLSVTVANEDLEQTMMNLDFSAHRDFIIGQHKKNVILHWRTANILAIYLPTIEVDTYKLPEVFKGLPENHVGELTENGRRYLVNIEKSDDGILYLSRDITLFESKERLFYWILFAISGLIIGFSLILSIVSGRHLLVPLAQLTSHIKKTQASKTMQRIELTFIDAELQSIASTFNHFLSEMELFVSREHSLINLASHELRTPISIITGAVEVVQQNEELVDRDKAALKRIQQAADEMHVNIDTLLKLSRREETSKINSIINLPSVLEEVLEDLSGDYPVYQRVQLDNVLSETTTADPELVKMLIRNLILNALKHTAGNVLVEIGGGKLMISNKNSEFNSEQYLSQPIGVEEKSTFNGLGLYIVTLICERLNWELSPAVPEGKGIEIRYSTEFDREL